MRRLTSVLVPVLVVVQLLAVSAVALADSPARSTREQKVRELLEVSGAGNIGKQVLDGMLEQFSKMPGLPAGFIERFQKLADPQSMLELVVPVYLKNLDDDALDAALAFYKSPGGRKFVGAQPVMTKESMEAGSRWGKELVQKVLEDLQKNPPKQE